MRVVVFGAGAIGGLVGARLFQHGVDVTLVARGAHAEALASGLVLEAPDESVTLPIPVVTDAAALRWTDDTVVLLAVKGQDTEEALIQLVTVAPQETPVVCMQNGVENERRVLRRFPRTYAMCVMCPASHLRPGVIVAHSAPVSGLLDLGRYPSGVDDVAETIAEALQRSTFESVPRPDIMRWKYRKLIMNLANAVEALSGRREPGQCPGPGGPPARERRSCRRRASRWRRPRKIWPGAVIACSTARHRRAAGAGDRAGRAWNGGRDPSRRSSSTARSSCSARSTAWTPR